MFFLFHDAKKTKSFKSNYPDCKVKRLNILSLQMDGWMDGEGEGERGGWMDGQ